MFFVSLVVNWDEKQLAIVALIYAYFATLFCVANYLSCLYSV